MNTDDERSEPPVRIEQPSDLGQKFSLCMAGFKSQEGRNRIPQNTERLMRLELKEFDFRVEYLKGKDNFVADVLSRIIISELKNLHS